MDKERKALVAQLKNIDDEHGVEVDLHTIETLDPVTASLIKSEIMEETDERYHLEVFAGRYEHDLVLRNCEMVFGYGNDRGSHLFHLRHTEMPTELLKYFLQVNSGASQFDPADRTFNPDDMCEDCAYKNNYNCKYKGDDLNG